MRMTFVLLALACIAGDEPAAKGKPEHDRSPDCVLMASLPKMSFGTDEAIEVSMKFENVSGPTPLVLWSCGGMNLKVVVRDERDAECELTDFGKKVRDSYDPTHTRGRDKNVRIAVKRGDSYDKMAALDVKKLYKLGKGSYKAQVTYHDTARPTPTFLESKAINFEIR
jgi:hypothetical protein